MLLLTTNGRVTGDPHTVPLLHLSDGDAVVVIASWGGRATHPEWFLNLQADPTVGVEMHRRRFEGQAEVLTEPERSRWWRAAVSVYAGYAAYQARTDRVIPVVRVRPR
jgi:deazaflavin-dependent oxidoreductase (nitroreductase family)